MSKFIIAIFTITLLSGQVWAGSSAGALIVAVQAQTCERNLKGETQYASMLHDERDQYEQQDAALVVQRDDLKQQIEDLNKQLGQARLAHHVPVSTPTESAPPIVRHPAPVMGFPRAGAK